VPDPGEVERRRAMSRARWGAGDYQAVSRTTWPVGERLVGHVGPRPGEDVLDVACGTGNAAVRAAAAGARVVGLDLTPELLALARGVAAEAGVSVEWVEGDAEALPFADASFDAVLSIFGCMFAPRHEATAGEIARVLRPGGRIGLCAWTPDGAFGDYFRVVGRYVPPPPGPSALLWGDEEHVRGLFAPTGVEPRFARELVRIEFASVEEAVEFYSTRSGQLVLARAALEREGRWEDLREDLFGFFARHGDPGSGEVAWEAEYLVVLGGRA
jgi:SAM-dependent methyltransferase